MRVGVVHTEGSPCRCAWALGEGLRALGHEALIADSADIERRAAEIARACEVVFDQTDTFAGRGLLRPIVRLALEAHGARLAGSDARACMLCDDKALAKDRMAAAGVPVPAGVVVAGPPAALPEALGATLVLKPASEQMSRGVRVVEGRAAAASAAEEEAARSGRPVLVEQFVPGREIAVSVLEDGEGGIEVLPPLEWRLPGGPAGILTAEHKLQPGEDRVDDALRAALDDGTAARIGDLARRAFRALGLAGYARFDVRLAADGTPFFLEANTKPSLEIHEALARSAGWAGMEYPALVDRLIRTARARWGSTTEIGFLPGGAFVLETPPGVHPVADSTLVLARAMDVAGGEGVVDLGCGSGLLAVAAARRGARRVLATDLDPRAVAAALSNARRAGVGDRVEARAGAWFAPLESEGPFDVIFAVPPQKPGPFPFGPRYGGPDGAEHLLHVVDGAADRLDARRGRLWLLLLSLANPGRVRARLEARFAEVALAAESETRCGDDELEALCPGLPAYLRAQRSRGLAEFADRPGGGIVFRNLILRAAKPRRAA